MATELSGKFPLKITDTTFRDAHQSVASTRLRTKDMEPIAEQMNSVGFHSMEVWGGATFDVATRFLFDDPWERLRILKKLMPQTPLQMLLRGQNLVGYRNYPDDVVAAFVRHSAECGVDIFRIFDSVNDERNLEAATKAVKASGKHAQLAICYSVTEEGRLGGPVYNLEYFLRKARIFEQMGADSICLKDMAGLLAPYDAYQIIHALKQEIQVPIQLHTHYTSGMASMTALKAAEAGLDVLDACLSPLALRTSQPAVEPIIATLRETPRDTGLDLDQLSSLSDYVETLAPYLRPHLINGRMTVVDTRVLTHQVPGGMISNLLSQLKEADSLDKLPEVLEEIPRTRAELGYPPLVTPTSQMVGAQALNNVLFGRWQVISGQMKDYFYGMYGRPPVAVNADVADVVLKDYEHGSKPITGRPGDYLPPELDNAKKESEGLARDLGDMLIYALYPVTGKRFLRVKYGLEDPPQEAADPAPTPTPVPIVESQSLSNQAKSFNIYLSGRSFQVTVDPVGGGGPANAAVQAAPQITAPAIQPNQQASAVVDQVSAVGHDAAPTVTPDQNTVESLPGEATVVAPMPGIVLRYTASEGQEVKVGDPVVILEAMKMENALPSPINGVIKRTCHSSGVRVGRGDVLVVISPS